MSEADEVGAGLANEWMDLSFPEPYRLDWEREGDEWLHHLQTALHEDTGYTGLSRTLVTPASDERYPSHYRITVDGAALTSTLRVFLLDRALLLLITGSGAAGEDQIAPWVWAIEAARERLGKTHERFEWVALIGEAPGYAVQGSALGAPCSVGALRLEPAESPMLEWVRQGMPSLTSRSGFSSWPIRVSGAAEGFDWFVAGAQASRELHRLSSLLSLAWDQTWTLRNAPQLASLGPLSVPREVPPMSKPEDLEGRIERRAPLSLPNWIDRAWRLMEEDFSLAHAASAHHEGLLMVDEHPSFALIAFVAAIEALGERLVPVERCPKCNTVVGSSQRFRKALSLVVSDEDVKELNALYTSRSRTAHAGHLHGPEASFDFMSYPGMFGRDQAWSFAFRDVEKMQKASRELLVLALTDGLAHDIT